MSERHKTTETEALAYYGDVEDKVFQLFRGLENATVFFEANPKLLDNLYAFSLAKYEAGWQANRTACIWYNRQVYKKLQKPPQQKPAQKPEVAKTISSVVQLPLGNYGYYSYSDVEPEILAARGARRKAWLASTP
jgi:hypothetical protein